MEENQKKAQEKFELSTNDESVPSVSEQPINVGERVKTNNIKSVVMLLIGLMIHDVSEGLSLGFQTEFNAGLQLFLAVVFHKWCE